ncbi:MAG: hypothetical protein LUC92_01585 [Clostridiales bacterium]|nr:hypothetical protein [Clostridiales bacterium]
MDDIRRNARLVSADKTEYINRLIGISAEKSENKKNIAEKEQTKMKKRLAEIDKILQSMYEDKVFCKISADRYASMSAALEKEEADLKRSLTEIQTALSQKAEQSRSAKDFADLIEN